MDITYAIHKLHLKFKNTHNLYHVKGHQDSKQTNKPLTLQALMNIEADALATEALKRNIITRYEVPFDPITRVDLSIEGTTTTKNIREAIQQKIHYQPLKDSLCQRLKMEATDI